MSEDVMYRVVLGATRAQRAASRPSGERALTASLRLAASGGFAAVAAEPPLAGSARCGPLAALQP